MKEKYILGRIGLNFWGFGEQLNKFWGFGEDKQNSFRELKQKNFRDLGRSEQYFQGGREQGPPLGGLNIDTNTGPGSQVLVPAFICKETRLSCTAR